MTRPTVMEIIELSDQIEAEGLGQVDLVWRALEKWGRCPHIVTSDEGTSYCALAEQTANSQSTPNDRQIRSSPMDELRQASADLQPASLSPAAQAVFDAVYRNYGDGATRCVIVAEVLRTLADQVVPVSDCPQRSDFSNRSIYQWAIDCHTYDESTRHKILAIAAELEGDHG